MGGPPQAAGHQLTDARDRRACRRRGPGTTRFRAGDQVGVAWLAATCSECAYCRRGAENLCPRSRYTGWDVDGVRGRLATVDLAAAEARRRGVPLTVVHVWPGRYAGPFRARGATPTEQDGRRVPDLAV